MRMTSGEDRQQQYRRPSQPQPQPQRSHPSPSESNGNYNDSQGQAQATLNGCDNSSYNNDSNGNIVVVGRAASLFLFDPNVYDAASYLPQEEQTHLHHHRRRHHHQQPPQYNHNVGPGHSNSASSTSQQLPTATTTSTPLTTPEYSYEWDPTNLTRFLSIRKQMACSLFATDDSSCRHHRLHRQKLSNRNRQEDIQIKSNDNTIVLTNNNTAAGEGGNTTTSTNNIHYDNTTVDDCGGIWCSHPNFFSSSSSSAAANVVRPNNANATTSTTTTYNTHHTNGTSNNKNDKNDDDDDNDHNSTVSAMVLLWNKLLPMPKDYFSYAIRYLFTESPLPLVGACSCDRHHRSSSTTTTSSSSSSTSLSKNNMTLLHPQRCLLTSSNSSSDGESIYLLPRYYLLRWMQWARYSIIHSSVKCWFDAWEKHDANHLHHDHKRHQRRKSKEVVVPDKETLERRRRTSTTNNDGMMLLSSHDRNPQKQQQRRRIYSLPSETIKALAALSLLSEQYGLFTNTERDFVDWMTNVEGCWNSWNQMAMEYHTMLDQPHRRQQHHQHDDSMVEEEHGHHCKEGEWDEINRKNTNHNGEGGDFTQRLQYHSTLTNRQQQQYQESLDQSSLPSPPDAPITTSSSSSPLIQIIPRPYPHLTFPVIESPGPIDSRMLSTRRNPLVMHRHVAISMKGILSSYNNSTTTCVTTIAPGLSGYTNANVDEENNVSVLSPADEASESKLISFIDNSLWIQQQQQQDDAQAILAQSTQKLAIVPVPISFYELLRSVHGVYSNDGDVSYAPPPMSNDNNVGKTAKKSNIISAHPSSSASSLLSTSSLLFHDQWKIGNDGANDDAQSVKRDRGDFHLDDNIDNNEHDSYYQGYHPLYFSNDPSHHHHHHHHHHHASAASTNGKPWPKHPLPCRPIEFRRQILPVSFQSEIGDDHEVEKENSKSTSNAATQSQYSRAMQEATKSKKTNHAAATTTTTMTTTTANSKEKIDISAIAGYAVEAFPVEFIYTIVECDAAPTSTVYAATNSGRDKPSAKNVTFKLDTDRQGINSHQGIALACRRSYIFAVLRDLQQVAAPNRAQTCVRLWKKSACEGATTKGDGYDLLDVDTLCAAPTLRLPPSPRGGGDAAAKFSNPSRLMQDSRHPSQLTVEQWLGLEPLSVKRINEQKDLFYSSGSEKPVRVELLVEIRQTIASKWVRDPFELTNRLQVRKTRTQVMKCMVIVSSSNVSSLSDWRLC